MPETGSVKAKGFRYADPEKIADGEVNPAFEEDHTVNEDDRKTDSHFASNITTVVIQPTDSDLKKSQLMTTVELGETSSSNGSSAGSSNGDDDADRKSLQKFTGGKDDPIWISGFTRKQVLLLFAFCAANVCSLACSSLHAPFYPKAAAEKQASSTAAGFVFGIFQLTVFVQSLTAGSSLNKIAPKRMALGGVFLMAVSSIVFGFLNYLPGATEFIVLSLLIRVIQATGNAAFTTASFAIIANEFPDSVARAIAFMETAAGLGLIVGPAVGGGLYEVGGFILPFIVMGILLCVAGLMGYFFLPDVRMPPKPPVQEGEPKPKGMLQLLLIPTVALAAFNIFAGANGIGYLLPTLERHVHHHFELPESFTGLIFIIDGTTYALFNPVWGWLCDKFQSPRIITLIGSVLIMVGFAGIAPVPFLGWAPVLWGTCVACAIFGLGLGASFVSGFVQGLTDAKAHGFPDNVATYGLVSGMWFSMMSLGCFAGATMGGILLDKVGFANGIYYILGLEAIVFLWAIMFLIKYRNVKNLDITNNGGNATTKSSDTPPV